MMMGQLDSQKEAEIRQRVETRMEKRREVYGHVSAYIFVNLILWSIWAFTGADSLWPLWVTGFWGMGVVGHLVEYYNAYGAGRERYEREVQRELDRERERLYGKRKNDDYYTEDSLFYDDDEIDQRHA